MRVDYDIVYVRMPRKGDDVGTSWAEIANPTYTDPGADLMLLHPDGTEEVLVKGGAGSVTDPMISFDGEWCYYVMLHNMVKASQWTPPKQGCGLNILADAQGLEELADLKRPCDAGPAHIIR